MNPQKSPTREPHDEPIDQDVHKGAVEGDRPDDTQQGNRNGPGVDENGMPDDPVATTEDVVGANEDESQG